MEGDKRRELIDVSIGCYHAIDHESNNRVQISSQLNGNLLMDFKIVQEQLLTVRKNLVFVKDMLKEANEELFLVKTMIDEEF